MTRRVPGAFAPITSDTLDSWRLNKVKPADIARFIEGQYRQRLAQSGIIFDSEDMPSRPPRDWTEQQELDLQVLRLAIALRLMPESAYLLNQIDKALRRADPLLVAGASAARAHSLGGTKGTTQRSKDAEQRARMLHDEAAKLRKSKPAILKKEITLTLADRGFGGAESIAKILRKPRPPKKSSEED